MKMNKDKWIKEEHYWVSTSPQMTDEWSKIRLARITPSRIGGLLGMSKFKTSDEVLNDLITGCTITPNDLMLHGIETEPLARLWYEKHIDNNVYESGICIPHSDYRFGVSIDGFVGNEGSLEIKCPKKMYWQLTNHVELQEMHKEIVVDDVSKCEDIIKQLNIDPRDRKYKHIFDEHYIQMMGNVILMKRQWIDYLVFSVSDRKIYHQRLYPDYQYWNDFLYPQACEFYENKIKPYQYLRVDPPV